MEMNLKFRAIGLNHQSELAKSVRDKRFANFTILYVAELLFSGEVTKRHSPYNSDSFQVCYPLNPMHHE